MLGGLFFVLNVFLLLVGSGATYKLTKLTSCLLVSSTYWTSVRDCDRQVPTVKVLNQIEAFDICALPSSVYLLY